MNNALKTKSVKRKINDKKRSESHSKKLILEVKDSLEDYKKGKYAKGDVNDILKAIRNFNM